MCALNGSSLVQVLGRHFQIGIWIDVISGAKYQMKCIVQSFWQAYIYVRAFCNFNFELYRSTWFYIAILLPHDCCCSTFSSFIPNILVLCHVSSFLNNTCSDLLDLIIHIIHGFLPPPNVSILSSQNDQERCPRPAGAVARPRATRETLRRRRPVRRRSRSRSQGWVEYQRISGEDVWINTAPWVFKNKGRWEVKFYLFGSLWKTAKLV